MYSVEIVSLWPQWMACYDFPVSGSLLNQYRIEGQIVPYAQLYNSIQGWQNRYKYTDQHRVEWVVETTELPSSNITLTYHTQSTSGQATRCYSLYDFDNAIFPCFILDGSTIRLRNLDLVTITTTVEPTYTLDLPDLFPDSKIWYLASRYYEIADSRNPISIVNNGEITVYYRSLNLYTELTTGTVRINNGPDLSLTVRNVQNWLDVCASIAAIKRFNDEDNVSLQNRIKSRHTIGKPKLANTLKNNLGVETNQITVLSWATSGALVLSDYGIQNATQVIIPDIQQYTTVVEAPKQAGYNTYKLLGIPENGLIYTGTIPVSSSANVLVTLQDTEQIKLAYRVKAYDIITENGYVTSVVPVSGNLESFITDVYVVSGVSVNTLSNIDTTEIDDNIIQYIKEKTGITIGYTTWDTIPWFIDNEVKPAMTFMLEELE